MATNTASNKITVVPKLLDLLDLQRAVVTADAMSRQRAIASTIQDKGGDDLLRVKGNQPGLEAAAIEGLDALPILSRSRRQPVASGHGGMQSRVLETLDAARAGVGASYRAGARTPIRVRAVRGVGDACGVEDRCFLTSLDPSDPDDLLRRCRGHREVENQVHRTPGVAFREDDGRVREGHGSESFSRLRRLTLNLPRPAKQAIRSSVQLARQRCGWDFGFPLQVATEQVQPA